MVEPSVLADKLEEVTAILTLGLGVLGLVLGVEHAWGIFVVGWLVVVPLIDIVGEDVLAWVLRDGSDERADEESDALATLQDRYARGEIDDVAFERQLERLLENETIEDVQRTVDRETVEAEQ